MLPDISYLFEEGIPRQPLSTLIGLSYAEKSQLAELSNHAKTVAPSLARELATRIQEFSSLNTGSLVNRADMELYLRDWFLQLFQCREEKFIGFQEYVMRIPINLVITGIDVILAYGHEITQRSLNPEDATRAFHKALALKIASEQLQSQADESQHFYEMMLLD